MKKVSMLVVMALALMTLGLAPQSAMALGSITGTITNAEGGPVAEAMVMVQGMDVRRGQRPFMGRAVTDENGAYAVADIPVGRYIVCANTREMGGARAVANVAEGNATVVDLQLAGGRGGRGGGNNGEERPAGSLTGHVLLDGAGVDAARVVLVPARLNVRGQRVRPINLETDANGDFAIEAIPAGVWVVTAGKREVGMGRERIEIVAGEAADITINLRAHQ
jgi:uncharacterized GH25 family protein